MPEALIILTPGFPKNEEDTACVTDRQILVKALQQTYPDINIIVLTFQYPFEPGEYCWNGVKVIALGGKGRGQLYRALTWIRAWRELKKLNRQYRLIGLLSFWMGECAFVADRFAMRYKLKHYCWLLGQDAKAGNKYVDWIEPPGETLIALSDFIKAEFAKNHEFTPKHLIPGAIDPSLFTLPLPNKDIDVIGVGSLIPLKQYGVFIDIIAALKTRFPAIKVMLCGKGPEQAMLQQQINKLNLQNNITLTDELRNAEILALMQRSKVFLHTSTYEGFGIVCLEALYAGAKVISFVRPMKNPIPNWQIAQSKAYMITMTADILRDANIIYAPVLPYHVNDSARAVMQLFNQQDAAIS